MAFTFCSCGFSSRCLYAILQILALDHPQMALLGVSCESSLLELFQHLVQVIQMVLPGEPVNYDIIKVGSSIGLVGIEYDIHQSLESH